MRFLLAGGFHSDAFAHALRALGHSVYDAPDVNWLHYFGRGDPPEWFAQAVRRVVDAERVEGRGFDAFLISKAIGATTWRPPEALLWGLRRRVGCMIYIGYDDPAFSPIVLRTDMLKAFDAWGTVCPGVIDMFPRASMPRVVFRHWLAWDDRIQPVVEPDLHVQVAFTGSPYYRPFEHPHHQAGFSGPRRDLVRIAQTVGSTALWGIPNWLDPTRGGDAAFAPIYRSALPPEEIHRVHGSVEVCVATHLVEGRQYESGRIPWVGGAGGCLLHEDRPGLREIFGPDVAWWRPGDLASFERELRNLLADDARRDAMRRGLRAAILRDHTWRNRAEELIHVVASLTS